MLKFFQILLILSFISSVQAQESDKYYLFEKEIIKIKDVEQRCTLYSFVGDVQNAMIDFENEKNCLQRSKELPISKEDSVDFLNCIPQDAHNYIINRAKSERIVLVNEGHNIPMHRAFTLSILQELYDLGYRYFGAETFSWENGQVPLGTKANQKYPVLNTGYYSLEPVFGDLVREALRIGFKVFPYEDTTRNNESITYRIEGKDTIRIINLDKSTRDSKMAVNINEILKKDSSAKILIHAGYGHICECNNAMGANLKRITGINPFSINQTSMSEAGSRVCESPFYKMIEVKTPSVFIRKSDGSVFLDKYFRDRKDMVEKNCLDIQVFHPRTKYINGRPSWLYMNGRRIAYNIEKNYLTLGFPIMVFAYDEEEDIEKAIPIDVFEVKSENDLKPLLLPNGIFNIIIKNQEGKTVTFKLNTKKI